MLSRSDIFINIDDRQCRIDLKNGTVGAGYGNFVLDTHFPGFETQYGFHGDGGLLHKLGCKYELQSGVTFDIYAHHASLVMLYHDINGVTGIFRKIIDTIIHGYFRSGKVDAPSDIVYIIRKYSANTNVCIFMGNKSYTYDFCKWYPLSMIGLVKTRGIMKVILGSYLLYVLTKTTVHH